jgi:hypothetical protein
VGGALEDRHSPDKAWWWSGAQWMPAWSPDGAWWFDGSTWRSALTVGRPASRPRRQLTQAEMVVAALWFALWLISTAWAAVTVPRAQAGGSTVSLGTWVLGTVLVGSVVLGTVVSAAWLAYRGRWWVVWLLVIYVSGLFFAWYVAAMLFVPVPAGQPDAQDDAVGAGLVFLALPTAVAVGFLVSVGTGVGTAIRAVHRRRTPVSDPI